MRGWEDKGEGPLGKPEGQVGTEIVVGLESAHESLEGYVEDI